MKKIALSLLTAALLKAGTLFSTPLDDYVQRDDPHYHWVLNSVEEKSEATIYIAILTSQQWRTSAEVNRPLWKHQLTVIVPKKLSSKTAILYIGEGYNDNDFPLLSPPKPLLLELALKNEAIVSEVTLVPNQFLKFSDEWDQDMWIKVERKMP